MRNWIIRILEGKGTRERVSLFVALSFIVAAVGGFWWMRFSPTTPDAVSVAAAEEKFRHPLTGELEPAVHSTSLAAVVIDHAGDAGTPSGVEEAFYVVEAPVEGNITRWLAFFDLTKTVEEIGPVRSARPYFVSLARQGWGVLFAHVGGSPEALGLLSSIGDVEDMNEYAHASTFWRSKFRLAPHNVFTSTARLSASRKFVTNTGGDGMPPRAPFAEATMSSSEKPCYLVTFGAANGYDVKWCYRPETNDFVRAMNGSLEKTKAGNVLATPQVFVMQTSVATIDEVGRKRIVTTGSGDAVLFQDGARRAVTWRRSSNDALLEFLEADASTVVLRPGSTWVEVVDAKWPITTVDEQPSAGL